MSLTCYAKCGGSQAFSCGRLEVARKILECLDLPARAPPLQPATRTVSLGPETDFADQEQSWEFDQTPPYADGTG